MKSRGAWLSEWVCVWVMSECNVMLDFHNKRDSAASSTFVFTRKAIRRQRYIGFRGPRRRCDAFSATDCCRKLKSNCTRLMGFGRFFRAFLIAALDTPECKRKTLSTLILKVWSSFIIKFEMNKSTYGITVGSLAKGIPHISMAWISFEAIKGR